MALEFQANVQSGNISAVAIDQHIKNQFTLVIRKKNPVLDLLLGPRSNLKKGASLAPAETGYNILIPIGYDNVDSMTAANLYKDPTQMPTGYPSFDTFTKMTMLKFPLAYFERPLGFPRDMLKKMGPGFRANAIEAAIDAFMTKWILLLELMVAGNQTPTRETLMGLGHFMATNNTVGGVSQTDYDWHQARRTNMAGAITAAAINNNLDIMQKWATEAGSGEPDVILADNVDGGVNVYGRIRDLILPQLRIVNANDNIKYQGETFEWRGKRVVQNFNGEGGMARFLNSGELFWFGPDAPKEVTGMQFLPASTAKAMVYEMECGWGIRRVNLQSEIYGVTG